MKKQLSESGRRKKGCSYKKGSSHDMYPEVSNHEIATCSTFMMLHKINYQNAGKWNIKILRK